MITNRKNWYSLLWLTILLVITGLFVTGSYIQPVRASAQETSAYSKQLFLNKINVELETPFQLQLGQVASINSEEVEIKFLSVPEDSRCPTGVQCVQAGQVTIELEVLKNNTIIGNLCLTSKGGSEDIRGIDSYSIKLVQVDPYPRATQVIETSDYVATLIVSKNSLEVTTSPDEAGLASCAATF